MGNNSSKKNAAREADDTIASEDLSCQSYSRLQEMAKTDQNTESTPECVNGNSKTPRDNSSSHLMKQKSSKTEKKKKETTKTRKKSDKESLVDSNVEVDPGESSEKGEHSGKSPTKFETVGAEKGFNVIEQGDNKQDNDTLEKETSDDEDYKTKHIIQNVENETRVVDDNSFNSEEMSTDVAEKISKDSDQDSLKQSSVKKLDDKSEAVESGKNTKKSKKTKKCEKGSKQIDDDIDKDATNEKESKKKKTKKDKKAAETKPLEKETTDTEKNDINDDDGEKKSKEKEKKHKKDEKKEKSMKKKDKTSEKTKTKDSNKKSKKEDKKKTKSKDELHISEDITITLSEDAPILAETDEMEEIEINIVPAGDAATSSMESDQCACEIPESSSVCIGDKVTELDNKPSDISNDTSVGVSGGETQITSNVTEDSEIRTEIKATESDISKSSPSIKARKDSANKKKKVKSQKNSYDISELSTSKPEPEHKKSSKKESKKKQKSMKSSHEVSDIVASNPEIDSKKTSKKESKKKTENKKLSKKNKCSKQKGGDGRCLLDSESSVGARSHESTNSLDRTRPHLMLEDFVIPEHINTDAISLSSVSLDGNEVFPSQKKSIIDHAIVPAETNLSHLEIAECEMTKF